MYRWMLLVALTFLFITSSEYIDRNGSDTIKVYPQPIKTITRVSSDLKLYNIEVYNILGSKVIEREDEGELDFSNLPNGYYLIKANSEKGELIKRVQKN